MTTSKKLTIFEGPDGGGKSTAAKQYAEETGARYVHFGPLPKVKDGLFRMYVEAMLPALLGYQDVVFDRSWLSEKPYGDAFRKGADRLGPVAIRMLERLAMRCGGYVVYCLPPFLTVKQNFFSRKQEEMLNDVDQLRAVYGSYLDQKTGLPHAHYDYTEGGVGLYESGFIELERMNCHPLQYRTAGNAHAEILLVGESFADTKNQDPFYQWPFASLDKVGCSHWITEQLDRAGIPESSLLWVNSDQLTAGMFPHDGRVIALGAVAHKTLESLGIQHENCPHPQHHRRFHSGDVYQLIELLKAGHDE